MKGRELDVELMFVQMATFVAEGRTRDALALAKRDLPVIGRRRPDLGDQISRALSGAASNSSLRGNGRVAFPTSEGEGSSQLLLEETAPIVGDEVVWPPHVGLALLDMVAERSKLDELSAAGLAPTRTLLFVGPPGVGKTLACRWIARELGVPLLTLDLAALMSNLLGRSGANLRAVLGHAQQQNAVLLLDEFDAIAKRRDDPSDVGEVKRLVTVLLQAIDAWPAGSLLVAATNHPELLDIAIWRRFERVVRFEYPSPQELRAMVRRVLRRAEDDVLVSLVVAACEGKGFGDCMNHLNGARRDSITRGVSMETALESRLKHDLSARPLSDRLEMARSMAAAGATQRSIKEITGIARDTLRTRGIATKRP